ncbi:hypothetical protein BGX23_012346 [Mortierella sp. AD031]|nr:hypothetical protein BGX23_012346 [Mortierella sp. AD031]
MNAIPTTESHSTTTPSTSTTSVVFVGNPGVGKSTLLNALGGNFANGFSPVGGLTKTVSSVTVNYEGRSLRLIDVPGVMESGGDNTISGNLQMLQETLNSSGSSVLFFVIAPTNGRIAVHDFAVIKTLLMNLKRGPKVGLIFTQIDDHHIEAIGSSNYKTTVLDNLRAANTDTKFFEQHGWLILKNHRNDFDDADKKAIRDYVFSFDPKEVQVENLLASFFQKILDFFNQYFKQSA